MGGGRWSSGHWDSYASAHVSGKTTDKVFTSREIHKDLNPHGVTMRESRDSEDNPLSNPIIIALDETGSMGMVLDAMVRGVNTLITEIYKRRPVTDPHIMCMGIGDVEYDTSPLQVTQFEADIRIAKQLQNIYLERGGGGNWYESYIFAWYFAAYHTSIDSFEKRGKKGYIFTIGDEEPTPKLSADNIRRFLGSGPERDMTAGELLEAVSRTYDVFHIMVEEGNHFRRHADRTINAWTELLGQRAIRLSDHKKLAEVIVSTIQVNEGVDRDTVVATWNGDTSMVVSRALKDLNGIANVAHDTGVVSF